MYNAQQKQEYLEQISKSESFMTLYTRLFAKTEQYEEILNKDVANFVKEEIEDMFIAFGTGATTTLATYLSMLSSYATYCCSNCLSVDNINHFEEIRNKDLAQYTNKFVYEARFLSRETVLSIVDTIPYVQDKFIVLALFEGLKGDNYNEIMRLTVDDIDLKTREFKLITGKSFVGSEELVGLALRSGNTYEESTGGIRGVVYKQVSNIVKPRFNVVYDDPIHDKTRIQATLTRVRILLGGVAINATKLHKSGFFHELNQLLISENITFDEAFSQDYYNAPTMQTLIKKFDYANAERSQIKHIYADAFRK